MRRTSAAAPSLAAIAPLSRRRVRRRRQRTRTGSGTSTFSRLNSTTESRSLLADLCLRYKRLYPEAVRFYGAAFRAQPKRADDLKTRHRFHAACAAALAIEIQVDLYTFFHPPAPYHQFFVLTTQGAEQNLEQGGKDALNGS